MREQNIASEIDDVNRGGKERAAAQQLGYSIVYPSGDASTARPSSQ